jgi:hypothetical protein
LEDGTNVWGPEDTNNFVRDRTPLEPLRFKIGDKVLANALGGWKTGHIIMVWDHGNPYRIELEDGTNVWGPEDIDKFVLPWTSVIPPMPGTNATEKDGKWVWQYLSWRVVVWVERRCARLFLTFFNLFLTTHHPLRRRCQQCQHCHQRRRQQYQRRRRQQCEQGRWYTAGTSS